MKEGTIFLGKLLLLPPLENSWKTLVTTPPRNFWGNTRRLTTDSWFYATGPSSQNPLKYALLHCKWKVWRFEGLANDHEQPCHLSAADGSPLAGSTCVRGTTTGDSSSLLCTVLLTVYRCDSLYSIIYDIQQNIEKRRERF